MVVLHHIFWVVSGLYKSALPFLPFDVLFLRFCLDLLLYRLTLEDAFYLAPSLEPWRDRDSFLPSFWMLGGR